MAAAAAAGELPAAQSLGFLSDVFVDFQWPDNEPPAAPPPPPAAAAASPPPDADDDANPRVRTAAAAAAAALRRKPLDTIGGNGAGARSPRRLCLDNSG